VKVDERLSEAVRMLSVLEDEGRVVRVAWEVAGRAFGLGRRFEEGTVIVREVLAARVTRRAPRERREGNCMADWGREGREERKGRERGEVRPGPC
jgi:hypothetical protein